MNGTFTSKKDAVSNAKQQSIEDNTRIFYVTNQGADYFVRDSSPPKEEQILGEYLLGQKLKPSK